MSATTILAAEPRRTPRLGGDVTTWVARSTSGLAARTPVLPRRGALRRAAHPSPTQGVRFVRRGARLEARLEFPPGTDFYGTGEVAGPLRRNGRDVTLWNSDAWGYDERTAALYQSHPFVLALGADGSCTGVVADTLRRGAVRCGESDVRFEFEGAFDVHVLRAESAADLLERITAWAGRTPPVPAWVLGYHQCRYSYSTAREVLEVAHRLRDGGHPCSALWLDIDYMHRYRPFTWSARRFPDPAGLVETLHGLDLRVVAILDPGIPRAAGYEPYETGLADGHFVLDPRGRPVQARVWPGKCHFPDFSRAATRRWWADLVERFVRASGVDGLWVDMNEPAVFDTPSRTLPDSARHRGSGGGDHARFHNAYGAWMAAATRAGLRRARPRRRAFVLTRANHLAGTRHAATWTGDNRSRWKDLRASVPMILNLGLSGQPLAGPDVPGFSGDPSAELFQRWFELAAFYPFARGHAEKSTCRKEPWSFGPAAERRVRAALERRVRWRPTLASALVEAREDGVPPWRPLWFDDAEDPSLRAIDDAFLFGPDVIVAPSMHAGRRRRTLRLPRGRWVLHDPAGAPGAGSTRSGPRLAGGREHVLEAPLGTTPVLVRAGAIVFTRADDGARVWNVFLDAEGSARGVLRVDPGGARASGCLVAEAQSVAGGVRIAGRRRGPCGSPPRHVVVHGARGGTRTWPNVGRSGTLRDADASAVQR